MDISNLTSQSLFNLLSLAEKKEELIQIIAEIDAEIIRALTGSSVSVVQVLDVVASPKPAEIVPANSEAPKAPIAKAGRSGGLKDRVLALLNAAGPNGLRVKEIAEKLKAKPTNIAVWFSTTGKNITTKVEPGRFASKAGVVSPAAVAKPAKVAAPAKPVKAAAPAKRAKTKSTISPEARAKMAAAATARWAAIRAAKSAVKPAAPTKAAKARRATK